MCSRTESRQNYVKSKVFEDELFQSEVSWSRNIRAEICAAKVGESEIRSRHYKAASIKVVYILKIPPLKLILPRCGLNTIFSTWKYKVIPLMEFFGILPRLLNNCLLCTIYYKAASKKSCIYSKNTTPKTHLPRCGLNTIFST